MIKIKFISLCVLLSVFFITSCSKIRESAGVNRKSIDEFKVYQNPPLIIPPDFDLIAPEQLQEKNIEDIDKELAKEILFGLDEKNKEGEKKISTMNEILKKSDALNASDGDASGYGTLPVTQTLQMARAGAFVRSMLARGAPSDTLSVGVRKGNPNTVTMWFYIRSPVEVEEYYNKLRNPDSVPLDGGSPQEPEGGGDS